MCNLAKATIWAIFYYIKGIVSAQTILTYMIDWGSKPNKNMFLIWPEPKFSLNVSFLSHFLVIVVSEKWLPRSKTRQWKVVTVLELVSKTWLPIQNESVKSGYRYKTCQKKIGTYPNRQIDILVWICFKLQTEAELD